MKVYYKDTIGLLPTLFSHSCGCPHGGTLQREDTSRYYKSLWTNAQM